MVTHQIRKLSDGMEAAEFNTVLGKRYLYMDADRYDYLVKYPDYLSFTGNMSVGSPAASENPFTDALIIWPTIAGEYMLNNRKRSCRITLLGYICMAHL